MSNDVDVQDGAANAIDILHDRGWFQVGAVSPPPVPGTNCLLTASASVTVPARYMELVDACAGVILAEYPERVPPGIRRSKDSVCMCFNDHPDTTFDDVIGVLEKVRAS